MDQQTRIAHGSLHRHGARLLPAELEDVDFLLLDGGPIAAPEETGPRDQLGAAFDRLAPTLYLDPQLRVVATLAGGDTTQAASRLSESLVRSGSPEIAVAALSGANVLSQLEELLVSGEELNHSETGQPFLRLTAPTVAAVLTIDADPLRAALRQDARVLLVEHAAVSEIEAAVTDRRKSLSSTNLLTLLIQEGFHFVQAFRSSRDVVATTTSQLQESWRRLLDREGVSAESVSVRGYVEADGQQDALVWVTFENTDEEVTQLARRLLLEAAGGLESEGIPPEPPGCSLVRPSYREWPTTISNELVEWSIDVRSAKDWLE